MKPNSVGKVKETESGLYQQLIFKVLPYWYIFLAAIAISLVAAFIYIKKTPPTYESHASLLIKDENKGLEDSKIEEALDVFGYKNVVENEVEILRSNALLREVGIKMRLYSSVFIETGWRNSIRRSAYEISPVIVEAENPETITKSYKAAYKVGSDLKTVILEDGKKVGLNEIVETPSGKIRFIPNPNFQTRYVPDAEKRSFLFTLATLDEMINNLGQAFQSKQSNKQSTVILLSVRDEVPKRGERLITEIVQAYNDANIRKKNDFARNTLRFLQTKLNVISNELDSVERNVQAYRTSAGIVDISEQGRQYLQSIQQNDQELNRLKIQSAMLDEVQSHINSSSGDKSLAPSTANLGDPTLAVMLERLHNSESEYERLKKTTAENNPILQSLQNDITKMRANISENVNNQRKSIDAGKSYLSSVNNRYSSILSTIPQKERQLLEVSRQLNTKKEIYAFLLQKKEEIEYSMNATVPTSFIVDVPMSSRFPVAPNKLFVLALAVLVPIGLCLAGIALKEAMNGSVLYRTDIEKMTAIPILGEVIYEKLDTNIIEMNSQRRFFKEQFRQIRTTLRSFTKMQGNKRILVTSSIQGEGKSFVAANLAISLANSGKKVALLEMDLYQPKIHTMFQIEPQAGITDFLMQSFDIEDMLIPSGIQNLTVIPAGNLIDSPSELLLNGRLDLLLNKLDSLFDYLVIDTPPVKPITDAFEISRLCDIMLYVIRHNYTPKVHIQFLDEEMKSHHVKNVAIIFNGIKRRGVGRYSYGYGYGYGYDDRVRYDEYGKKKTKKRLFA